jgi:hypothetical protein
MNAAVSSVPTYPSTAVTLVEAGVLIVADTPGVTPVTVATRFALLAPAPGIATVLLTCADVNCVALTVVAEVATLIVAVISIASPTAP